MSEGHQRFSIIPGWIVTDPRLKGRDLQVLCLLGRHIDKAGWCFRSQVKMARQLACARSTIQASLDRLMKIGVVERRAGDSLDGRDVSYHYRVVFDRDIAASTLAGWEDADAEDGDDADRKAGCRLAGTPADIPAPPADPGSAPPAGPGSAPYKNVPDLTPPAEPEREAREGEREEGQPAEPMNRKSIERAFEKAFQAWPTSISDSRPEALRAWLDLLPEEREAAFSEAGRYAEAARATGRTKVCSHAVYLREKRWLRLEPREEAEKPAAIEAKPFGPLWGAARIKQFLTIPPAPLPGLTAFQRRAVEQGLMDEAQLRREQQAKFGWPGVNFMHQRALDRKGVAVEPELERLSPLMEPVPVGSETYQAWQAEHARRGWSWIPDPGEMPVVFFPRGGPEAGIEAFEAALRGEDEQAVEAAE